MHGVGGGLLVSYTTPLADTQSLVSPTCWKPPVDRFLPQSAAQCPSSPHRKHLPGLAGGSMVGSDRLNVPAIDNSSH